MYTPTFDCEYGNYKDMNNEVLWQDDFFPSRQAREEARSKYKECWYEILSEIAAENGLDTSAWDEMDFNDFADRMDLY